MISEQLLIPGLPGPIEGPAVSGSKSAQGAGRRRTLRQHAAIDNGAHPLSVALDAVLPLHPLAAEQGRTCWACRFRTVINLGTSRSYPKCLIEKGPYARTLSGARLPRVSAGPGTDIRKWWPGCRDHEWGDNSLGPDAARSGPPADNHE